MVGDGEFASTPPGIIVAPARRFEVVEAPAQLDHRSVHRQQGLGGGSAEGHDHLRFDHRNLSHQERRAGRALVALRLAISRRAALYDVRDVDLLALDPHRFDHVVKQLPGAPDEGLALFSFIGTPPLAEEPQLRLWITDAKHNLLPSRLMEHTARTIAQVVADDLQRLHRIAHSLLGLQRDRLKNILFNHSRHHDRRGLPWTHLFSRFWIYRNS